MAIPVDRFRNARVGVFRLTTFSSASSLETVLRICQCSAEVFSLALQGQAFGLQVAQCSVHPLPMVRASGVASRGKLLGMPHQVKR